MENGSQSVFHDGFAFIWQKAAHNKDSRIPDAAATERDAFIHRTDGQPVRPFSGEHARNLQRAMAVGIGLDDGGNFDFRANHGLDVAEITRNSIAGN